MMFPRTIKNSLTKKVLSVSLIGCITVTITAAAMQPFLVYASVGSGTVRGLLIGASALLGTGNINVTSINYLNNNAILNSSIESVYDGTISVSDINSALSGEIGTARWTAPLGNNAQQVTMAKEYVSAAGGDSSSLNGLGAASVGENIKAMADYYYEHGELKPAFGGQTITDNIMGAAVMQSMADVAYNFDNVMWYARENNWTDAQIDALFDSGAAFGDLQSARDYIGDLDKTIVNGYNVDEIDSVLNKLSADEIAFWQTANGVQNFYWILQKGIVPYQIRNGNSKYVYGMNVTGSGKAYRSYLINSNNVSSSGTVPANTLNTTRFVNGQDASYYSYSCKSFNDFQEANTYYQSVVENGVNPYDYKSPDIITKEGQANGTWTQDANANNRNQFNLNININYDTNYNYTIPDETIINNYIQDTQDAINNGESQEDIGDYLKDLIEEMKQSIPQPTEAPYPTMSPSTIPVQPTEAPKPTNTPEQEQKNTTGMATPELAEKFPFCIPFDLFSMMSHFTSNRSAPYIDVELDLGPAGVHHIELDFSVWDSVAALLRLLELIVFIAGLALTARRLIGAGGD